MKRILLSILLLTISTITSAVTYTAGDIYSFSFDNLFLTTQDPNTTIDQASIGFTKVFDINNPTDYILDIRLFEDNDPLSTPFATGTATDPVAGFAFLGLNWPLNTWSDLNGLIEIEVIQGTITNPVITVIIEDNGQVYSSIQPVPLPASIWLFSSALIGLYGLTISSNGRKKHAA